MEIHPFPNRETHLPSINVRWWGGTSSLPWVNKSIGEGENTCAFVLDSLWLWGGIVSTYIICYCIMFRNYSFVIFVVRPKRFCPFDPFGVCFCLFDHAFVFGYASVLHIHSHYAGRCLNPESLRVFWLLFADVMCECVKPCLHKMRAWEQQEFF